MNIDPTTGKIELESSGFVICPGLTQEEFLSSSTGANARLDVKNNQYSTYSVLLKNGGSTIFGVSLVFEWQRLDSVRIETIDPDASWANWSEEKQLKQKSEHDRLLIATLGRPPYRFPWGEVVSTVDPRSGSANINVQYSRPQ